MTGRVVPRASIIAAISATAVLAALPAGPVWCAESAPESEEPAPGVLDAGHAGASERVRRLGAWLDEFFADENYEAEINKSWLRIRVDSFSELYEGTDVTAPVRLHLKLPALNNRLRFEILSPDETDDIEASEGAEVRPTPSGDSEEKTSAAVSYVYREEKERSIIARLGMDFDGYAPNPYVGGRYRELVPLNDVWNFRFTEQIRYYSRDGVVSRTSLDFERIMEEDMLLRISLDGTWLEDDPDYFYSLGFALFRPLDDRSAVEYQIVNSFRTDPHRLDRITARIRHRQKIWRDWLTFEVAPQVSFPDDRDFEPVPAILFRLEATFGG